MRLSDISIKRPVFATMLNVVLVIFGLFSLPRLAVDLYPNVDFPVVAVTVLYPGADPESVEQKILEPLERAVNGLSGLKNLSAQAFPNIGQLVLRFSLEKDSNEAAQQVRDKIFAAVGELPTDAKTPIVQKFDIGGAPIMNLSLRGNVGFAELSELAKDRIQPALERVDDVASVRPAGLRPLKVQVLVNRLRLSSFGLNPSDIVAAIKSQNLDLPSGKIEKSDSYEGVRVKARLSSASELALLPIANAHNANLRIADVADVKETIADEESAAFVNDQPTILFAIQKQEGANTPEIANSIRAAVVTLNAGLPEGVSLEVVTDNSTFIKGSVDAVQFDLIIGALLAIFIVLIFLQDLRITIISAAALPTAVIATFAFMAPMSFSLNMMTTLALSLSIGILIDDAIIVVENIHRHLSLGKSGEAAARDATREIGLAVIATTLTLCAVFIPVAFMQGIVGRFFFQFGLTVAFAVLVSLFVAFTLTPMMSARLLVNDHEGGRFRALKGFLLKQFGALETLYRKLLRLCLDHRGLTLFAGFAIFVLSIVLLRFVPVSFFPTEDRASFSVDYQLPEGSNLNYTKAKTVALAEAIKSYPGVLRVVSSIGASSDAKVNKASLAVTLVDKSERSYAQSELMDRLREDLKKGFATEGSSLSIGVEGGGPKSQAIQLIFKGDNWATLEQFTDDVARFTKEEVADTVDVTTSKPKRERENRIVVNTQKAADLGLSSAEIGAAVRSLFEGEDVGSIVRDGKNIEIRMRIADENRASEADISGISILSRRGGYVSLNSVASVIAGYSPSSIERLDGQRQITVLANFKGKDLNAAVNNITSYVNEHKPAGITMVLSGQAEIMKDAISSMMRAMLLAVILVFIILCIQYESYSSPLVIMASLPLSLSGAFGALLLTGQVMSIYAMIGVILLMGLVTKNGILLIDFSLQKIREGMSVKEALLEAGPLRLRPILMTTFAAGGGMLPVAIGHGIGGEARSPMGVAVIGGLLASTLLTLVVVPCLFSVLEELKQKAATKLSSKRSYA